MKKILATTILGLGITVQAQTNLNPGQFWTNQAVYTNILLGATALVPLSTNGYAAAVWVANRFNQQFGLQTTNRFTVRDMIAYAAWQKIEDEWIRVWRDDLDAVADRIAIRQKLTDASDAQLNQIKAILGL